MIVPNSVTRHYYFNAWCTLLLSFFSMHIEENIFLDDMVLNNLSKWHLLPSNVTSYFMDAYCNIVWW